MSTHILLFAFAFYAPTVFGDFKIMMWNLDVFGAAKMSNATIVDHMLDTVEDAQLIIIQDIRDISNTHIHNFLALLNARFPNTPNQFGIVLSSRQGRTSSKEQIAMLYHRCILTVQSAVDWPDPSDIFERDPYVVRFSVKQSGADVPQFIIISAHIKPSNEVNGTFRELQALDDVHREVERTYCVNNILIAGALNSDCSYLSNAEKALLDLRTDARYQWLINDTVDTATSSQDCTYDHFISTGGLRTHFRDAAVVPFDAQIPDRATVEKVSDHYPIAGILNSPSWQEPL